jgi:hypothetical protein
VAAHDTHDDHICLFFFQFSFVMFLISRGHHLLGVYPKVLEHETTDTGFCFLSYIATTNWQLALLGNGEDGLRSATTHTAAAPGTDTHWRSPLIWIPLRSWNTNAESFTRTLEAGWQVRRILVIFQATKTTQAIFGKAIRRGVTCPSHTRFNPPTDDL